MTSVDSLLLDANQAIPDEHRRRFQVLHQKVVCSKQSGNFMSRFNVPITS